MFYISDLSTELQLTEKSYIFPFTDTSLDPVLLDPLEILSRQNWVGKLEFIISFKFKDFFPLTNK